MSSLCRPTGLDQLVRACMTRGAAHCRPLVCAQNGRDQVRPHAQLAHVYGAASQLHGLVSNAPLMPKQAMQSCGTKAWFLNEQQGRGNGMSFKGDCHLEQQ